MYILIIKYMYIYMYINLNFSLSLAPFLRRSNGRNDSPISPWILALIPSKAWPIAVAQRLRSRWFITG